MLEARVARVAVPRKTSGSTIPEAFGIFVRSKAPDTLTAGAPGGVSKPMTTPDEPTTARPRNASIAACPEAASVRGNLRLGP